MRIRFDEVKPNDRLMVNDFIVNVVETKTTPSGKVSIKFTTEGYGTRTSVSTKVPSTLVRKLG